MKGGDTECAGLANFHSVNTFIMTDFKLLMKVFEHVTTEKCMLAMKSVPGPRGLMFVSLAHWCLLFSQVTYPVL